MNKQEIILNLWYVIDDGGLIYSLRGRCYVHSGTDEEKLTFLQKHASSDYLIAQPFHVPERFHTTLIDDDTEQRVPMATYNGIQASVPFISLFEDAIQELGKQLPAQTKLSIPQDPIVCMTPLLGDEDGDVRPLTANSVRF